MVYCSKFPSGKTEDGKEYDVIWDNPPHLMIRGAYGKILAAQGEII